MGRGIRPNVAVCVAVFEGFIAVGMEEVGRAVVCTGGEGRVEPILGILVGVRNAECVSELRFFFKLIGSIEI